MLSHALFLVSGVIVGVLAEDIDSDMGPAAFLFPSDRAYSASLDNTAPCGSVAQAGNRTDFPITGGFVGLVDQEEAYDVQISISYSDNPLTNSDFEVLVSSKRIKDLYEGHTCIILPNPPSNISVGDVATLQVIYESVWDDSTVNQTFYACADIKYILDADFTQNSYCFNATTDSNTAATTTATSSSGTESISTSSSKKSKKGISNGAIAGAVVGSVCGAAILVVAGFLLYRLGATHQRQLLMRYHMNNMALGEMGNKTPESTTSSTK
ncbi:cytokine inducing-glycoprotein [Grosmannia clavigera kw1407]|uniref:Cytokine inducing-glycoprotein n=1 Tax=Grosmannia clavigera (strain kw1407 / UAMH 11150) TaxID=655863 RepID=F0XJC3_GROCL|nr:cytokine inducing-glycoprotein [Grosmannia clavigera kw1407]EFX02232.1 cytokine inducing-glycoprotein [Grosmannia clavigera kw1407]